MRILKEVGKKSTVEYQIIQFDRSRTEEYLAEKLNKAPHAKEYYEIQLANEKFFKSLRMSSKSQSNIWSDERKFYKDVYRGPAIVFEALLFPVDTYHTENNTHIVVEDEQQNRFLVTAEEFLKMVQGTLANDSPEKYPAKHPEKYPAKHPDGWMWGVFVMYTKGSFVGIKLYKEESN